MSDDGNRGPNDTFRRGGGRRRREPPIIDASATDVELSAPLSPSREGQREDPVAPSEAAARREPSPAEPVLFGSAAPGTGPRVDDPMPPPSATEEADRAPTASGVTGPDPFPEEVASTQDAADQSANTADIRRPDGAGTPLRGAPPPSSGAGGVRFGALPGVLGVVILALLGAIGWLLYTEPQRGGRAQLAGALADLQTKVAALEARPDPAQVQSALTDANRKITSAEADRAALRKDLSDLEQGLNALKRQAAAAQTAAEAAQADAARVASAQAQPPAGAETPKAPTPDYATAAALAALGGRVEGLDGRISTVVKDEADTARALADLPKPVAPDFGPVNGRIATLETALTGLGGTINGTDARLNGFDAKINGVDAQVNGFDAKMNGLAARMNNLEGKLDDMSAATARLETALKSLPRVDLGPLQATAAALAVRAGKTEGEIAALTGRVGTDDSRLSAVDGRLGALEADMSVSKDDARVTEVRAVGTADESKAASLAVVGQALGRAVAEGRPFPDELQALKALGAESDIVDGLAPAADTGVKTPDALAAEWEGIRGRVTAALKPEDGAGGALDRFTASARALVQVRRVGSARPGDSPDALVSQIDAALAAGRVSGAIEAWDKLPDPGKDASREWATQARQSAEAAAAARTLVARAVATIGRAAD